MDIKVQDNKADIPREFRVGVLGGGVSSEREVSLVSAQNVFDALKRRNLNASLIDISDKEKEKIKRMLESSKIDVAFIALHGEFGEDGQIQQILEEIGIPYAGSKPWSSYLAMNKILSKMVFQANNIPTPDFYSCDSLDYIPQGIGYPVVVKPYFSGSSIGVSIVDNQKDLRKSLEEVLRLQEKALIEKYIEGRELTVGILEAKALGVVEVIPKEGYYDFKTKYSDGMADYVTPADLSEDIYKNVQDIGLAAHNSLGCNHFSRVDIRLGIDNVPYVLEVNSIPGLTSHSLLPLSAKCYGIDFDELISRMLLSAFNGKKEEKNT